MSNESVTITAAMHPDAAWEFAQFLKRTSYVDCYEHTEAHLDPEERKRRAYRMIAGIEAIQAALAEQGYSPR